MHYQLQRFPWRRSRDTRTSWMQLPPLMSLQECAQGGVAGQGALIGAAADRQIQAHPRCTQGGDLRRPPGHDTTRDGEKHALRPPLVTGSSRTNRCRSRQSEP
uniref:Uncharacterized protein n=1 Tax=Triticum urartu TaxID=4572 RepID=A0A8R7R0H3_TRIUA